MPVVDTETVHTNSGHQIYVRSHTSLLKTRKLPSPYVQQKGSERDTQMPRESRAKEKEIWYLSTLSL